MSNRSAASRWREALAAWAIPEEILARAPESPWAHPPKMFAATAGDETAVTPSHRAAQAALASGGTVLDIGCGGGRSSLPLASLATMITGVDEQPAMLANFARACDAVGVAHHEVVGRWPDVATMVQPADVVVCHHVVYNVADIEPFVRALTEHARRRVVVELTDRHPLTPFAPLWQYFWNLPRPDEPSADLFVEVVRALGHEPVVEHLSRPPRKPMESAEEYIAFVRRRLCLTADRDPEIAAQVALLTERADPVVTVSWDQLQIVT